MNLRPLVSVIVNCYNGENYLKEALDSIYDQTYHNWEIIFFDNCSSDASAEIAKKYDSRLKYIFNQTNVSLGEARHRALNYARGDWIGFLDVDDLWLPAKLETQIEFITRCKDADLVYSCVEDFSIPGAPIRVDGPKHTGKVDFSDLLARFDINMVTPLIRKKFLDDNNLSFIGTVTASEEYNLFMRCAAIGKVYAQKIVLGQYRLTDNSLTDRRIESWAHERFLTLAQCIELNPKLLEDHPVDFIEAIRKGCYYRARYLMHSRLRCEARKILKEIGRPKTEYWGLYFLARSLMLWNFFHRKDIKARVTSLIRSIFRV